MGKDERALLHLLRAGALVVVDWGLPG